MVLQVRNEVDWTREVRVCALEVELVASAGQMDVGSEKEGFMTTQGYPMPLGDECNIYYDGETLKKSIFRRKSICFQIHQLGDVSADIHVETPSWQLNM